MLKGCEVGADVDPNQIDHAVRGSFSKPGAQEIVGEMKCPPADSPNHATVLARKTGARWVIVDRAEDYDYRVTRGKPQTVDTGRGYALVLFLDGSGIEGRLWQSLDFTDYTLPGSAKGGALVTVIDTTGEVCAPDSPPRVAAMIDSVKVDNKRHVVWVRAHAGVVDNSRPGG